LNLNLIWEYGMTRHDREVLGKMGYARRYYVLMEIWNSHRRAKLKSYSRGDAAIGGGRAVSGTCRWRKARQVFALQACTVQPKKISQDVKSFLRRDLEHAITFSHTSRIPLNDRNVAQSTTSLLPQQTQVGREEDPQQVYFDSHSHGDLPNCKVSYSLLSFGAHGLETHDQLVRSYQFLLNASIVDEMDVVHWPSSGSLELSV
jgi:hypothetical protein